MREEKKYYEINKKYLAEGIAWLGFRYYKVGYGKNTVYKFEDTPKFRKALTEMIKLKERVGKKLVI